MALTQSERSAKWRREHPERDRADRERQQLRRGPVDDAYRQTSDYRESQKRYRASEKYKLMGRSYRLEYYYGLTPDMYQKMLENQNRLCALCRQPLDFEKRYPSVDHDHRCCSGKTSCGKCVRGIVHQRCNLFLGFVEAHPDIVDDLKPYLEKHIDA
jgi:hypothetical protein